MQELICFSAFLYQYIDFFVFLKVARRGAIAPLNPPLQTHAHTQHAHTPTVRISDTFHYLQLEVACTHSKKNYKSTGVYGETIFRIHLNVWSNYYHFNNSVIQVYNKYVYRISYNFPWQISLSVITYLPWLQPLLQLVS